MATTVNTDLVIYDDLAQTAFLERRQDNLEVFNASSNGAILLDNELIEGDFRKRAFYKVGGSIESRNVNSVDKVTGKKIGAGEAVSVKAPWKYGPYETTEEAFKRRGRSVDEFSEVIGVDVADATLEGYVKYGLKALTAAIGANADMVVTADIETDGKKTLTRGLRKYGDKFNRVVLFVMHSATYFDIVDEAIANKIYEEAGVVVYGGHTSWQLASTSQGLKYRQGNGTVSGLTNVGFSTTHTLYSTQNTSKSSDGTLKAASPVARIVKSLEECQRTDIDEAGFVWCGCGTANAEAEGITLSRLDVGVYVLTGSAGLASEGWQLLPPMDPGGMGELGVAEAEQTADGELTIRLFKRKYMLSDEGEIIKTKGEPMDVPVNSWIDVRLDMPADSVFRRGQYSLQSDGES